jgi:hypothetical protein
MRRIHLAMRLVAPEKALETVERVHGLYAMHCPLYRTLRKAIELTSSYTLEKAEAGFGLRAIFVRSESSCVHKARAGGVSQK